MSRSSGSHAPPTSRARSAERGRTWRPTSGSTRTSWAAGRPSTSSCCVERHVALDQGQRDRAELVVAGRGADEADHLLPRPQLGADRRQPVLGAVEVEQREPARRTTEVVHPRDGLLPAVAALVQVDGRAEPADLVGDRPVVGVEPEPWLAPRDPQRLVGPQPAGRAGRLGVRRQPVARHQLVPAPRAGRSARAREVTSATSTRLMNRIRSRNSTSAAARPGSVAAVNDVAVVDAGERVLDVPLRAEDQRLRSRCGARGRGSTAWSGRAATAAGRGRRCGRRRGGTGRRSRHRPRA